MLNHRKDEDELDLSDMIDEYEEDQELRKKIDAMKQAQNNRMQKPVEKEYVSREPILMNYSDDSTSESVQNDNFDDYDGNDDVVFSVDDSDESGKTRVVMNQPLHESDFVTEPESESSDDSIYMYDNREVVEEEITEEDIEEFLGNDQDEQPQEKTKVDPAKMNKIITYAITGVVALCLLIGIGFGVKAMLDHNSSEDKVVDSDKDKDKDKDKENDKNKDQPVTNIDEEPDTDPDNEDKKDNSKRIAKINGQITAYNKQIEDDNQKIAAAKKVQKENQVDENVLGDRRTRRDEAARNIERLNMDIESYNSQCSSDSRDEEFCSSFNIDEKTNELKSLQSQLTQLDSEVSALENKKKLFDQANVTITQLNDEVKNLNNEITRLNKELQSLSQ